MKRRNRRDNIFGSLAFIGIGLIFVGLVPLLRGAVHVVPVCMIVAGFVSLICGIVEGGKDA